MPSKLTPNIGLSWGWIRGEDFWGGPINDDLVKLDALVGPVIRGFTFTEPPVDAEDGWLYQVPDTGAAGAWSGQDGMVALRVEGAWQFIEPKYGWRATAYPYDGAKVWFDGDTWLLEDGGGDPTNPDPVSRPVAMEMAITVPDDMYSDEVLVHYPVTQTIVLSGNMAGSAFDAISSPSVSTSFRVQRNGQNIGTIAVAAGQYNATFSTSGGNAVTFGLGDRLTVRAPVTPVPGFKNFGLVLRFSYLSN